MRNTPECKLVRQTTSRRAARISKHGLLGRGKHMLGTRPSVVHTGAGEPSVSTEGKLTPSIFLLDNGLEQWMKKIPLFRHCSRLTISQSCLKQLRVNQQELSRRIRLNWNQTVVSCPSRRDGKPQAQLEGNAHLSDVDVKPCIGRSLESAGGSAF